MSQALVFISYARGDALEFARQLAADLAQRGGQRVWLDLQDIEKGGLFDARIEQGIRAASVVAAVMTPGSVREQSVCRDEIVFALNENRPVVPLRAHPEVRPPLLLARRNWVDFTAGYEQGLEALLRYLKGDATALRPPRLPTVTGLAPLDFGPEIARHSRGFTGRQWLARELDDWLTRKKQRALVLVGEPGVGKSAIAAWLCLSRPEVVGIHFCTQRNTRTLEPHAFVASLVGQLHARLPGFAEAVEGRFPEARRDRAADAFRELIVEPARSLPAVQSLLVVVDSLDEAAGRAGETVVDVLAEQAADLPPWLRVLATTRPEARILDRVRALSVFELNADRDENRADVRASINNRLQPPAVAERLAELAAGNFLYARLVLDALEEGTLAAADLGSMTPGLAGFYERAFRQRFPDVDAFERTHGPLLRGLAVARAPLSFALLRDLAGATVDVEVVHRRLRDLRAYLRITGKGETAGHALFHKSLADWLTDREAAGDYWCPAETGHARLAEVLLPRRWEDEYALPHLLTHLLLAGKKDRVAPLLLDDWPFLEAKCAAGLTYELPGDCEAAAAALPAQAGRLQELRRFLLQQAHVLHLRPALLFQQAANGPEGTALAEAARAAWESGTERRPWLRWENRPPRADAPLLTLSGHQAAVRVCAWSPDGRRIASGAQDGSIRLWDADTGACLRVLEGHTKRVTGCAFSPDGRRLVTSAAGGDIGCALAWDVETGARLFALQGPKTGIGACDWSADGRYIAAIGGGAYLWDAQTGALKHTLDTADLAPLVLRFSPDGRRLTAGGMKKFLRTWSLEGDEPRALGELDCAVILDCAYAADANVLAAASTTNTSGQLDAWDAAGNELVQARLSSISLGGCAVSPDGRWIAAATSPGTVRVWDLVEKRGDGRLRGHTAVVRACAFSPAGDRLVSASSDGTLKVWDVTAWASGPWTCPPRAENWQGTEGNWGEQLRSCQTFAAGRYIAGILDVTVPNFSAYHVAIWDAATGNKVRSLKVGTFGNGEPCPVMSVSRDGSRLGVRFASAYQERASWAFQIWDARDGCRLGDLPGLADDEFRDALVSPDGRWVVTLAGKPGHRLWDAGTFAPVATLPGPAGAAAWSADGSRLALVGEGNSLNVWAPSAAAPVATLLGHSAPPHCCAWSPDGQTLVSTSADGTVRLWDVNAARQRWRQPAGAKASVAFSPDGRQVLTPDEDGTLVLRDARTGAVAVRFAGLVTPLAHLSPDGRRVVAVGEDGAVQVRAADTGSLLAGLEPGLVGEPLGWCLGGERIYADDRSGSLRFFHLVEPGESFRPV